MTLYVVLEVNFDTNEIIEPLDAVFTNKEEMTKYIIKQRNLNPDKWYEYTSWEVE